MEKKPITIIGAGPVGCLLSILLTRLGYRVTIYDKRSHDAIFLHNNIGRSINIALSTRGITALHAAMALPFIQPILIPMFGRNMHDNQNIEQFIPYSSDFLPIYSVSRDDVNRILASLAIDLGVEIKYNMDFSSHVENILSSVEHIIATDGLHSGVRNYFEPSLKVQQFSHSYAEFKLYTQKLQKSALHIWPEADSMLIALPNKDESFTATLFIPNDWLENGIEKMDNETLLLNILQEKYPTFYQSYYNNILFRKVKFSTLESVLASNWIYKKDQTHILLLSDAAHGVLPFYGQGMNAGFEDARLFAAHLEAYEWDITKLQLFVKQRIKDVRALHKFVNENFYDMKGERDFSQDFKNAFDSMKRLKNAYPHKNKTRYEWVSFSNIPYSEILDIELEAMYNLGNI